MKAGDEHPARDLAAMEADMQQLLIEQAFRPVQAGLLVELLRTVASLQDQLISIEVRLAANEQAVPARPELRTIADLVQFVAAKLKTEPGALRGREAEDRYIIGRQIVALVANDQLRAKLPEIGRVLGNRSADEVARLIDRGSLRRGMAPFETLLQETKLAFGGLR